jgi:predicted RNase H-like HicB family nuclease
MPGILTAYIRTAMQTAIYQTLEDGSYFAEIPSLEEVWAHDSSLEGCQAELQAVLEEWIAVELHLQHPIPAIDGVTIAPLQPDESDVLAPHEVDRTEERVSLETLMTGTQQRQESRKSA